MNSPFQPKKKVTNFTNDSVLESLRDLGANVGKTVTGDVVGKIATDALSSIFGGGTRQPAGELRPEERLQLGHEGKDAWRQRQIPRPELQPRPIFHIEEQHLKQQIEAVRSELKAIAASLKNLHQEVQTAVEQAPVDPGIYHLNFFEKLRSFLKLLREQIDDSRTWLTLSTGRKKKAGYWGLFKKHGTKFGLSSERTLATQAG